MDRSNALRAMRIDGEPARRRSLLGQPHIAPLAAYAASLRTPHLEVPDFDPLDGGVEARVLFLFEKPGPMTSASRSAGRAGSGFISRDNDDFTAAAVHGFMQEIGLPRAETVLWNAIPWWNGQRAIGRGEVRAGAEQIRHLFTLLPKLRAVVLVGKRAQRAGRYLQGAGVPIVESDHPSPLVKARWRLRWEDIPADWKKVLPLLS